MRWEFRTPQKQSIISDGSTLWIYQPDERQVLKAPFSAGFVSTTPVSFLAGVGRIKDDFEVAIDRRGCNAQRIYLKLVPKSSPDIGTLTLAVTRPTHDIVEAAVTDPIGNVTTLSFSNLERNVEPADDEFHFVVPEGVDVVSAPGSAPPQ
jgi:outer membrane lipoprotein carrier protein